MDKKTEIKCSKCGEFVGYEEDFRFMVLYEDVKCPKCGIVVIAK